MLKQGVEAWNQWRQEYRKEHVSSYERAGAVQTIAFLLAVLTPLALLSLSGFAFTQTLVKAAHAQNNSAAAPRHVSRSMDILLNKPGGPEDWPAYAPTNLSVPANSLVTLTIRNFDLGDPPLPATSPYAIVQGT